MQPSSAANRALAGRATLHAAFSQPPPPDLPGPALPDSRRRRHRRDCGFPGPFPGRLADQDRRRHGSPATGGARLTHAKHFHHTTRHAWTACCRAVAAGGGPESCRPSRGWAKEGRHGRGLVCTLSPPRLRSKCGRVGRLVGSALLSAVWGVLRVPAAPRSTPQQPARALARGRLRPLSASSLSREESESHSEE